MHTDIIRTDDPVPDQPPTTRRTADRRPITLALLWSLATGAWAITWVLDLLPHPFGVPEEVWTGAVLNLWDPLVGSAFILVLAVVGTAAAVILRTSPHAEVAGGRTALAVEIQAWLIAGTIGALVLHGTVIAVLGYTPVALTLGWFSADLRDAYLEGVTRPEVVLQLVGLLGAVLWARVALLQRRVRTASCHDCGRAKRWSDHDEFVTRRRALRVGRIAVAVAAISALAYPSLRLPWAFGYPVGMDAAAWSQLNADGTVTTGIALGIAALGGGVLMLGLVQGWGERFPRWMAGLAGRRVPVGLAVVPAAVVAIALTAAGRGYLTGVLGAAPAELQLEMVHVVPLVALLPWGLGLGVATAAYAVRRRAVCGTCEQGMAEVPARALR